MRRLSVIVVVSCVVVVAGVGVAPADVLGPFCLVAGPPLSATFNLSLQTITTSRFAIVGHVFGEEPIFGSGIVSGGQVRLAVTSGPRGITPIAPPLSLMAILATTGPIVGTGYCTGGAQCSTPTVVTLSVQPCSS